MRRYAIPLLLAASLFGSARCSSIEESCRVGSLLCQDARSDRSLPAPERLSVDRLVAPDTFLRDRSAPFPEAVIPYQHEDISAATLHQWIVTGKAMTLIDVREPSEFAAGHIAGALNLAWNSGGLKGSLSQIAKDRPVVVYCASGNRSNQAATWLTDQGLRPVYDMLGGIAAWLAAGYPTEM
jgi:rhodanese-related sulfurtransferase